MNQRVQSKKSILLASGSRSLAIASQRYKLTLLHTLVTIVLSYQLVFAESANASRGVSELVVLGLIATIIFLFFLPSRFWKAKWFTGTLVMSDTLITCLVIYLSGHATSNLYMTFFLIILIAAFAPTLKQLIMLSVLLCTAYGVVLSWEIGQARFFTEGHLLQIPVLLILGIFYGMTNETARTLGHEKDALVTQIRERKRAEKALRESEERYRQLVQLSPDAIFIIRDNKVDFLNDTGYQMLSATSSEQIIGRSPLDFFDPDDQPIIKEQIQHVLQSERAVPFIEKKIIRLDGTLLDVEVGVSTVPQQGSRAIQLVLRNVTERNQLQAQLHQAKKMEAVGELAGGIAHDFNNMLTVISGHSDFLVEDPELSTDQRQSANLIKQAAQRSTALTSQLLAFSRRQVLQPKVLSLNALVTKMEQILSPLLGANIELKTRLTEHRAHVRADPTQLEQVIYNVVFNAREAMPECGKLTLTTDIIELDKNNLPQYALDAEGGAYVVLEIKDTGVGMDPITTSRIFEPFFTTKPRSKGTGLGLSTAYGIIRQSGGFIDVESQLGYGTTLTILLPQVLDEVEEEEDSEQSLCRLSNGTETILIAEDEVGVRSLVRDALRSRGYGVLEAKDGSEALAISSEHSGPIHLVLTDVVMPQMNGRELGERLVLQRPEAKVMYMSGYTDDAIFRHGVIADKNNFIQKPFTVKILENKVRRVLDQDNNPMMTATQ